jgi:7-cyano-7-deazaguanine synthase
MKDAVVLLSGGLDSATCLAWAIREGFAAHALTVNYGQRHAVEIDRAAGIARRLGASTHRVVVLDLSFLAGSALTDRTIDVPKSRAIEEIGSGVPKTYVPARNTVFLALALAWAESLGAHDLVVGVNRVDYSGYPDCRPEYLSAFATLAGLATRAGTEGASWRIHAPLVDLSKGDIVRRAVAWDVPYGDTISCYDPEATGRACGSCDACLLRARGFKEAGIDDPAPGARP